MAIRDGFFPDDIDRIEKKYFTDIRRSNAMSADPSYWFVNKTEVAETYGLTKIKHYTSDYGGALGTEKEVIAATLSLWDETSYNIENLTLCSSATTASLAILTLIRSTLPARRIYFETPSYFASIQQAEYLGANVELVPTYTQENFYADRAFWVKAQSPKVIWITQPRFGIGENYDPNKLSNILSNLADDDLLIIDEATEQIVPSPLRAASPEADRRILKIRSPFKGMGINGPRFCVVLHHDTLAKPLRLCREQMQGAIDRFSLNFAVEQMASAKTFFGMLASANDQVTKLRRKLSVRAIGHPIEPSNLENGYIGSVAVQYSNQDRPYVANREALLRHCAQHNMPVILGANLRFAIDHEREFIRLNYFNSEKELIRAIDILSRFATSAS